MGKKREREPRANLSAAELARRKVGEEEKWGIGSDGTREEDEGEEDVWDSGMEDLGYEEERRRAVREGRGRRDGGRGGGDKSVGRREAKIAGLTDWYNARHPELVRNGGYQGVGGGTGGRNAAGRGANGPNRTLPPSNRPPNSPQPSLFPSRPFAFNYVNSDLDPGVDERLNRRLEAAALSSAASSNDHSSSQIAPPLPSPIILLRADSPAQSEIDRRHFNGRSRRLVKPKPMPVEEGGAGWWGWFRGGGGGAGETERRVEEIRAVDDGLTAMPPSASQSRRERSGNYVGLDNEDDTSPIRTTPKPSFNIYANPPPMQQLQRPSFPIGPNSLRIYNAPTPLSPTYTHRHLPSISSPSSIIPSPLIIKPSPRHRESTASYVSSESPLDRFSNGSALDNPDSNYPYRSVEHSENGTFGPSRPSSPALLAGMELLPALDLGSPNSFMTALSSPPPLSPSPRRQSNPFFPPQPPIVVASAPPPPQAPVASTRPPSSTRDSSPPTRPAPREINRFYLPESRAVPRKIIL